MTAKIAKASQDNYYFLSYVFIIVSPAFSSSYEAIYLMFLDSPCSAVAARRSPHRAAGNNSMR